MRQTADSRQIHELLAGLPRFGDDFDPSYIPGDGIYVFYERGELFEGNDRIVRVGTHIGEGRLKKRLKLHYCGRARRSVFRRNVGNALVRAGVVKGIPSDAAPFSSAQFDPELEEAISARFVKTFTFSVFQVDDVSDRLRLEAGLIASLASDPAVTPSEHWLGHHSTVESIRGSGLWNRLHVGGAPLPHTDFELLRKSVRLA
jgi:hypothetical protein